MGGRIATVIKRKGGAHEVLALASIIDILNPSNSCCWLGVLGYSRARREWWGRRGGHARFICLFSRGGHEAHDRWVSSLRVTVAMTTRPFLIFPYARLAASLPARLDFSELLSLVGGQNQRNYLLITSADTLSITYYLLPGPEASAGARHERNTLLITGSDSDLLPSPTTTLKASAEAHPYASLYLLPVYLLTNKICLPACLHTTIKPVYQCAYLLQESLSTSVARCPISVHKNDYAAGTKLGSLVTQTMGYLCYPVQTD